MPSKHVPVTSNQTFIYPSPPFHGVALMVQSPLAHSQLSGRSHRKELMEAPVFVQRGSMLWGAKCVRAFIVNAMAHLPLGPILQGFTWVLVVRSESVPSSSVWCLPPPPSVGPLLHSVTIFCLCPKIGSVKEKQEGSASLSLHDYNCLLLTSRIIALMRIVNTASRALVTTNPFLKEKKQKKTKSDWIYITYILVHLDFTSFFPEVVVVAHHVVFNRVTFFLLLM